MRFSQIPQEMVGTAIKDMEKTTISVEDYLTQPLCQPSMYSNAVKSPMLHLIADDITKREEFLKNIWLYYSKKRKDPEIFDQLINAKNTKGDTLLDYLEISRSKNYYTFATQQIALGKILEFLCSHGDVYSTQKDMKCP